MANDSIIPGVTMILGVINKAIDAMLKSEANAIKQGEKVVQKAEDVVQEIKYRAQDKKYIKSDRTDELSKNNPQSQDNNIVNQDNCVFYYTNSLEMAKENAKYLKYNNIPSIALKTEQGGKTSAILIIPKQYEKEADKYIKEANKVFVKTEVERSQFCKNHCDEQVITFEGVDDNQLRMMRDALYDKSAEYCAIAKGNDAYSIMTTKKDRDKIAYAFYETALRLNGKEQKDLSAHYEYEKAREKRIIDFLNGSDKNKKDLVMYDYKNNNASIYRLQREKLIEYKTGEQPKVIITQNQNREEYAAKILALTKKMDVLAVGSINSNERISKTPDINNQECYSKEEIAKAKEEMARQDNLHGRDTAETMAHQIVALMVTAAQGDTRGVNEAINSSIKLSELSAWADAAERSRFGVAEKLHRLCDDTSLDVTVMEDVLQFAHEDINYILEQKNDGLLEQAHTISPLETGAQNLISDVERIKVVTLDEDEPEFEEFIEQIQQVSESFDEQEFDEPDFDDEYLPAGRPDGDEVK